MPLIPIQHPTLIQGVSQQPDELKLPGQLTAQENAYPSPVEGLRLRHNTDHRQLVSSTPFHRAHVHPIDRDSGEQYLAVFRDQGVQMLYGEGGEASVIGGANELSNPNSLEGWSGTASIAKTNEVSGPSVGFTPFLITHDATDVRKTGGTPNRASDVMVSAYIKRRTGTNTVLFTCFDGAAGAHGLLFNPDTGAITAPAGLTRQSAVDAGDGWWLVRMVFAVTAFESDNIIAIIGSGLAGAQTTYMSDPRISLLTPEFSYLALREPNQVTDPEDFTTANWTISGLGLATAATSVVAPYGVGTFQRIRRTSGGTTGGVFQTMPIWTRGPQVFSVHFALEGVPTDSEGVRIEMRDQTGTTFNHFVEADWVNGVLEVSATSDDVQARVEPFTPGISRLWLCVNTETASATDPGDFRQLVVFAKDADTSSEKTVAAWGAKLENGVHEPTPYIDPEARVKATTVADFTFVANGLTQVAMTDDLTPPAPDESEGYIFVRQAAFSSIFRVKMTVAGTTYMATTATWNGSTDVTPQIYELRVPNTNNATWNVRVNGTTNVGGTGFLSSGSTAAEIAEGVAKAINADANDYTAVSYGDLIQVIFTDPDANPTLSAVDLMEGATVHPMNTVVDRGAPLQTTSTDVIAADLAGKLDAIPNVIVDVSGSVVRLTQLGASNTFDELMSEDSAGARNIITVFRETEFFDDLPRVAQDGYRLKIAGEAESNVDDYFVVFDADSPGSFGRGVWRESTLGSIGFRLDDSTMPHLIVRRQDDEDGVVTGRPNEVYFEWARAPWAERLVGSLVSNGDPAFVGQRVREVFYWQDRLGFLSGQSVSLSETGSQFNFFRTKTRVLPGSERINISAGHTDVSLLEAAVAVDEEMVIFSDRTQFFLAGDPVTPESASLQAKMHWEVETIARPVGTGESIFFPYRTGQHSGVREIRRSGDQELDAGDTTSNLPAYLPGDVVQMSGTGEERVVACRASDDRARLYLYKYTDSGQQRVQSAWFRYSFGSAQILGAVFIREDLHLILERDGQVVHERMEISEGLTDPGASYRVLLDRRIGSRDSGISSSLGGGATTFTLPYSLEAGATYHAYTASGTPVQLEVTNVSGTQITVTGDYTDHVVNPVWIGEEIAMSCQLPHPVIRDDRTGRFRAYENLGRLMVKYGILAFRDSARFGVRLERTARASRDLSRTGAVATDKFRVPVLFRADASDIFLENTAGDPCSFMSMDFTCEYNQVA